MHDLEVRFDSFNQTFYLECPGCGRAKDMGEMVTAKEIILASINFKHGRHD